MAHSIFFHNDAVHTVRLNALQYFEVKMHLTSQRDIYYVLPQVKNISQEIRASSFNTFWARRFGNGSSPTKFFCSVAPYSEQEWPLRAR